MKRREKDRDKDSSRDNKKRKSMKRSKTETKSSIFVSLSPKFQNIKSCILLTETLILRTTIFTTFLKSSRATKMTNLWGENT